jgi:putative transposase
VLVPERKLTLVTVTDEESRDDRRRASREATERLKASVASDELFARIDAGEVELGGHDGLIQQLIKAGLGRGLQAELSDHLGHERGDPAAAFFPNSRNGSFPKTVASQVGDIDLDRDESGNAVQDRRRGLRGGAGLALPLATSARCRSRIDGWSVG